MAAITILDGGMGRELLRIGAPFQQPEWSALALMEGPDYVRQVHQSFIAAGAEVITTNSYAVVPYHIGEERFAARGRELATLAGQLGREAIAASGSTTVKLAGSLPPVFGSYRPELFRAEAAAGVLAPLIAGLAPSVDLWLAETQGSILEARTVRAAVGRDDPRPFWLSFTLEDDKPGTPPALRSGERVRDAAEAALDLKVAALLFNCSDPSVMEAALRDAAAVFAAVPAGERPRLGVYANAFTPHSHKDQANETLSGIREDLGPPDYVAFAEKWQAAGASIVGGCCGIGPDYISALSAALKQPA